MAPDPWMDADPWGGNGRSWAFRPDALGKEDQWNAPSGGDGAAARLIAASVQAGATRHQLAALGAALWRLEAAAQPRSDENLEVQMRLDKIEPCLRAQVRAADRGRPSSSSATLVTRDEHVMSTAAKHLFPDGGIAALTPVAARLLQRGPRKSTGTPMAMDDSVLDPLPRLSSETRYPLEHHHVEQNKFPEHNEKHERYVLDSMPFLPSETRLSEAPVDGTASVGVCSNMYVTATDLT